GFARRPRPRAGRVPRGYTAGGCGLWSWSVGSENRFAPHRLVPPPECRARSALAAQLRAKLQAYEQPREPRGPELGAAPGQAGIEHVKRLAASRLAAPRAAAEELPVAPWRGVRLAQDQVQAAARGDFGIERDVGAAARHAGGDGDAARRAGRGDDFGFGPVVAGIEQHVLEARLVHPPRERPPNRRGVRARPDGTPRLAPPAGAPHPGRPPRPRLP